MNKETIAFNTGAHYTEHGQRIAAAPFAGYWLLVDKDRQLVYLLNLPADKPQSSYSISQAYLNNNIAPIHEFQEGFSEKRAELENAARNVQSI